MSSDRTRFDSQRAVTRMSESILPTVCCIILRQTRYNEIDAATAFAAQSYESFGENCNDDQLSLLRAFKFTAEQWMIARRLHPVECEY